MPNSKTTLNVGMIGAGFMGKAHSNAFCQTGHFFEIAYELRRRVICARDSAKLAAMASRWGWEETETDWRAVVERPDIDVVDIAVPNALHAPIALAAAAAGKIVLCEKPLGTSLAESQAMAESVRKLPNMVWYNYRRVPAIAFAKQLIDEGRTGQHYHYRAVYLNQSGIDPSKAKTWRYSKASAGSGVSGDLLSHSIDTALYLNGPMAEVVAETHTFFPGRDVDDAVMLLAKFANGSMGTFEATRYGVGCRNRNAFEINGSGGMLRFDLEDMNRLEFLDATDSPEIQARRRLDVTGPDHPYSTIFWKPGHAIGYEHTFIAALGDFCRALAANESFHPNFDDALAVERVLDVVRRSSDSRRWEVVQPTPQVFRIRS
jgi:predicted dehydrogenase